MKRRDLAADRRRNRRDDAGKPDGRDRPDVTRPASAAVDGVLLLNKPAGMTSNQAKFLQKVKRLLNAKRPATPAAWTLRPPACCRSVSARRPKYAAYLLDADKTYRVVARLGEATDTGDADGKVTDTAAMYAGLAPADWQAMLRRGSSATSSRCRQCTRR